MRIFDDAAEAGRALERPWVTIGNFDGLHLGHRAVIASTVEAARGAPVVVVTFRPHPAAILSSRGAPPRVVSDAQQEELLESLGVDGLLRLCFDAAFAAVRAASFHEEWLGAKLRAEGIVVGTAFRYGAGREGDVSSLRSWGGIEVRDVPPVVCDGEVVSSSRVRRVLEEGRVEDAWRLLARPHALEGRVVEGERRGRTLGFPTANVEVTGRAMPGLGVHACALRVGDRYLPAVANVGHRPTFGGGGVSVEVHSLDDPGDLYGTVVRVAFLAKLRDERKFDSRDALVAQIREDVEAAKRVHAMHPPASLAGPAF